MWAHRCTMGECVSEASLHTQTSRSRTRKACNHGGAGKGWARIDWGTCNRGGVSRFRHCRPVSRGHARGSPPQQVEGLRVLLEQ